MDRSDTLHWFAMRALYQRETKVQALLEALRQEKPETLVEVFIPMKWEKKVVRGRMRRVQVPAIGGLMFVRWDQPSLQEFKSRIEHFQYMTFPAADGRRHPIIVPDRQMQDFIRLCEGTKDPLFLDASLQNLAPGTPVRVIGGPFMGMTGTFQRVAGKRSRHFVVRIPQLLSVAAEIPAADLEVIKEK